jgi:hypothetical protein
MSVSPCRSGASRDRANQTAAPPASKRRDSNPDGHFQPPKRSITEVIIALDPLIPPGTEAAIP